MAGGQGISMRYMHIHVICPSLYVTQGASAAVGRVAWSYGGYHNENGRVSATLQATEHEVNEVHAPAGAATGCLPFPTSDSYQ